MSSLNRTFIVICLINLFEQIINARSVIAYDLLECNDLSNAIKSCLKCQLFIFFSFEIFYVWFLLGSIETWTTAASRSHVPCFISYITYPLTQQTDLEMSEREEFVRDQETVHEREGALNGLLAGSYHQSMVYSRG